MIKRLALATLLSFGAVSTKAQQSADVLETLVGLTTKKAAADTLPPASTSIARKKAEPIHVPFFEKSPVIDGKLNNEEWTAATVLNGFLQVKPGDNIPATQPTEVYVGYDSKFLYIAFKCLDDPKKIRATVAKRDAISKDDLVGVLLDTFHDQRKAYVLAFNPFGIQQDAVYSEGKGADYSVDIVMESKGSLSSDGYVVEASIPFSSLRYATGKESVWGVHFFREVKRLNNEVDSWMPISRDQSSLLTQAGSITGLEKISTQRPLEIIPSLTISESGQRVRSIPTPVLRLNPALRDPGHFVNIPTSADPGVTVKLGLKPTVTLDLAINPDFAQVEADQTVITANQRFPIFFEEKRPFFLEGIDIFRTQLNAVHTRAVVDPDVAVKLTGKTGRTSFGLLLASDNAPGNFSREERNDPEFLPRVQRFLDKNAYIGVLRLKRDIGREDSLGLIATSYNFIERHNDLGGFDGRFHRGPNTVFSFQLLGSTSRRFFFDPDLGRSLYRTGNAFAYAYSYEKSGRRLTYQLDGLGRTRDYRADVGFTRRTNTNSQTFFVRYGSEPNPKAKIIAWRASNSANLEFDWQGRIQGWENTVKYNLNLHRQTSVGFGLKGGYERVFESEFGANRTATRRGAFAGNDPERSTYEKAVFISGDTTPSQKYSAAFVLGYIWGTFDYDLGSGSRFQRVSPAALLNPRAQLDPGPGNSLQMQMNLTIQPTASWRTSLTYTKFNLLRDDTQRLAFDDNIYSLRSTYQFTRFVFARARIDYSTLSARARGQFLIGWNPNPGTAFFAGYNDDINYGASSPFTGQFEPGFRRNNRMFYIKMSYLIRRSF